MSIHICSQIQPVQTVQWYLSICFKGWQFGTGQSVAVLSPREGHFSHSQLSLVVYGSMSGTEAWGFSSSSLTCPFVSSFFSAHTWAVPLVRVYGCSFWWRHTLRANSLIWLLQSFHPLLLYFIDIYMGTGLLNSSFWLGVVSVMVPIYYTKKFPWCRWGLHLSVGIRTNVYRFLSGIMLF